MAILNSPIQTQTLLRNGNSIIITSFSCLQDDCFFILFDIELRNKEQKIIAKRVTSDPSKAQQIIDCLERENVNN